MDNKYVLITSARNEAQHIEELIHTIVNQTILPVTWVLIDDNSNDKTGVLIKNGAEIYPFIAPLNINNGMSGDFSSKVFAIMKGFEIIKDIEFNYLGILDADISLPSNYYEIIISKMKKQHNLGICGGVLYDCFEGKKFKRATKPWSVPGGIQFFKKECFFEIGGLIPLPLGSEDSVAEITARMKGWYVSSFNDVKGLHNRRTSEMHGSYLRASYIDGFRDYSYGCHPIFECVKCLSRLFYKPIILSAVLRFIGYLCAALRKTERPVSLEFIKYLRNEQMERLFPQQLLNLLAQLNKIISAPND
ncbi:MAG TPA: glycosyltransferase family A protein [Chitinispirillaceae bacterium]|nr:glycosyltransferase family A protein [Chitinispirillaceae bacterium]